MPASQRPRDTHIEEIILHRVDIPLVKPYKISIHVYHSYDTILVEMRDRAGTTAWGEAVIRQGYSDETVDSGWAFCRGISERLRGLDTAAAKAMIVPFLHDNSHAGTALISAIEMLEGTELLALGQPAQIPLLVPVQSMELDAAAAETERHIAEGFRTLKVKVGFEVPDDLRRVAAIQRAAAGRATIRLDANQAWSREDGIRFATALDPTGIELFEQPCAKHDWDANAAVAERSAVPVMLDESIYGVADIDRAAKLPGVGYVKVKLKKLGGPTLLHQALRHIEAVGLRAVLGDGVATDVGCWMETCIARDTIRNAGEMNGFLKLKERLFANPMTVADGAIALPAGYVPQIDRAILARYERDRAHFTARPGAAR